MAIFAFDAATFVRITKSIKYYFLMSFANRSRAI